jgi:hypothetical protein
MEMQDRPCEECDRLRAHHERLVLKYKCASGALAGAGTTPEYDILKRAADEAQMDAEAASLDFQCHLHLHLKGLGHSA